MDTDLEGPESINLLVAILYPLYQYFRACWVTEHLRLGSRSLRRRAAVQIRHRWGVPANPPRLSSGSHGHKERLWWKAFWFSSILGCIRGAPSRCFVSTGRC